MENFLSNLPSGSDGLNYVLIMLFGLFGISYDPSTTTTQDVVESFGQFFLNLPPWVVILVIAAASAKKIYYGGQLAVNGIRNAIYYVGLPIAKGIESAGSLPKLALEHMIPRDKKAKLWLENHDRYTHLVDNQYLGGLKYLDPDRSLAWTKPHVEATRLKLKFEKAAHS